MITVEFIQTQFQEILGRQYRVMGHHAFSRDFTNPVPTPMGWTQDIDYKAFDEHGDVIIAVINAQSSALTSVPFRLSNDMYTVDFWVPLDAGDKFNFYKDMERLAEAVRSKKILLDGLQAFFTMSEPAPLSNTYDSSGSYKRLTFRISGNISLSDERVGTGSDIQVSVMIGGQERFFKDVTDLDIVSNTEGNVIQLSNSPATKQDAAVIGQQIVFAVDDFGDSPEMELIKRKAYSNNKIITPEAEGANRLKILTKIYKKEILQNEFWGLLSVEYLAPGKTQFGKYRVSIVNGG